MNGWRGKNSPVSNLYQQLTRVDEEEEPPIEARKMMPRFSILTEPSEIATCLASAESPFNEAAFGEECPDVDPSTL